AFQTVCDDRFERQAIVCAVLLPTFHEQFPQRLATHVLHDDETTGDTGTWIGVLGEIDDLDDVGVLDLRQERPFRRRCFVCLGVTGVEQALEHDPAIVDIAITRQVDPSETTVGQTAQHLVLATDQVTLGELGAEGELGPTPATKALRAAGAAVSATADLLPAVAAKTALL